MADKKKPLHKCIKDNVHVGGPGLVGTIGSIPRGKKPSVSFNLAAGYVKGSPGPSTHKGQIRRGRSTSLERRARPGFKLSVKF